MTALPPSPFISNSAAVVMPSADTAAAFNASPGVAAAGPFDDAVARDMWATLDGYPASNSIAAEPTAAGLWDEYDRDQKLRALYDVLDPPQPPLFLRTGRITDVQPDPSLRHILKVFFAM